MAIPGAIKNNFQTLEQCPYRKVRLSFFSYTYRHSVLTVNLPLLTIPLF
jgi:hypothetical protein